MVIAARGRRGALFSAHQQEMHCKPSETAHHAAFSFPGAPFAGWAASLLGSVLLSPVWEKHLGGGLRHVTQPKLGTSLLVMRLVQLQLPASVLRPTELWEITFHQCAVHPMQTRLTLALYVVLRHQVVVSCLCLGGTRHTARRYGSSS